MKNLADFKRELSAISDQATLSAAFSAQIRAMGFAAFDAFSLKKGTETDPESEEQNFFFCDYGRIFAELYVRAGMLPLDPSNAEIAKRVVPYDYVAFLNNVQTNSAVNWQKRLLKVSRINQAWQVPLCTYDILRGVTVYMVGSGKVKQQLFVNSRDELHLMSASMMEKVISLRSMGDENMASSSAFAGGFSANGLSAREADCLIWAARGMTNREIGKAMEVSENTVRFHFKNMFRKMGVQSRSSAVSQALKTGVIEL